MIRNRLITMVAMILACGLARGAEVRLRTQARTTTGVIRLGDVAEIFAAETWQAEQLAAIELGPAPAAGTHRFIRAREVQDALFMRGINLSLHKLAGADRVEVLGPGVATAVEKPLYRADEPTRMRAEKLVADVIVRALERQSGTREPWRVKVSLTDDQIAVAVAGRRLTADGGQPPWVGKQQFTVEQDGRSDGASFSVEADVTLPPGVVVAVRPLPPGTILHAGDLALKTMANIPSGTQPFYRIEDVAGQATTYSIASGAILGRDAVQRPIAVRRGAALTLYAKSSGLRVRTTVRAREDGAIGDLITVESLSNREPFYARVSGIQEAEVFAAPAEATQHTAAATTGDRFESNVGGVRR